MARFFSEYTIIKDVYKPVSLRAEILTYDF